MDRVLAYLGIKDTSGSTSLLRFGSVYAWVALAIAVAVIVVLGKFVF